MDFGKQKSNNYSFQFVDNRPESVAQRKLQGLANKGSSDKYPTQLSRGVIQRELHHFGDAPFSAQEAEQWNQLVQVANGLGVAAQFIANVENEVWDINSGVTVAGSIAGLRALIRAGILTRLIDRTDADSLGWGEFAPMLAQMAARYGQRTGPVATGGHAAHTYTYTTTEGAISIAEEINAHGQTSGNLNTRRGQMRNAIDLYNSAVTADADQYI